MEFDFVAIDFETATSARNSACSLGIVAVKDGQVADTFYSLIKPPALLFHPGNIRIHNITPPDVQDAPTLDELWPSITRYFTLHCPVLAHNAPFDMSVLRNSAPSAEIPDFPYADTLDMAADLVEGSRGLANCARELNLDLEHHHNALDDAGACAQIAILAMKKADCLSMWEYLARNPQVTVRNFSEVVRKDETAPPRPSHKFDPVRPSQIQPKGETDPNHPLYGKRIAFTGPLSISRRDAMQRSANVGALLRSTVSPHTDYLVVGRQDITPAGSFGLSVKEEKAVKLQKQGCPIRLLSEQEFFALLEGRAPGAPLIPG